MTFLENLINAFFTIISNKLRSGLTMLGVIIGVTSVIVMVAIGEGAQKAVTARIEKLGTNLLIVVPGNQNQTDVRGRSGGNESSTLTNDDFEIIKKDIEGVSGVSPEISQQKQVIYKTNNARTKITGVTQDYLTVRNSNVEYGQFISNDNILNVERVAVLGKTVAETLFGTESPIGNDIRIGNSILTVIGVMKEQGQEGFQNADDVIYVPLSTAQKRLFGVNNINTLYVSVTNTNEMEKVKIKIEKTLMSEHGISTPEEADFTVLNQVDIISTMNEVTKIFTLLLGSIAGISLVVGGIGVMNIMLVSVTERTREIGLRKAIGAKRKDILFQFLTESIFLCVFGGIIGIALSFVISSIIKNKTEMNVEISVNSILLAFLFSVSVGVFFGIFPAYKAGKLKPIDALRFE